jgi:hypothetical protein
MHSETARLQFCRPPKGALSYSSSLFLVKIARTCEGF